MLPLAQYLSPQQFRDALSLRYNRSLMLMLPTGDGCGAAFTLSHAMDCRRGGLVVRRHNEICDALGDLACLAYKDVIQEPIVCDGDADGPGPIVDLGVCRVWQPQGEALFDVHVVDTDTNLISLVLMRMFCLVLKRRKNESIDWLQRRAMLPLHLLLNQARAGCNHFHRGNVCVCVCVCVSLYAPKAINN